MKKWLFIIIAIMLVLPLVVSADVSGLEESLDDGLGGLDDARDNVEDVLNKERADYLKKEWGVLLRKNSFLYPILNFYERNSRIIDPIFKYTIGLKPSATWLFILTLVLWIFFIVVIWRTLEIIAIFSQWMRFGLAFVGAIAISNMGVTRIISELIIEFISFASIWWVQLIAIIILILILLIGSVFSKYFQHMLRKKKEKEEEALYKRQLKSGAGIAKSFQKLGKKKS